MNTDTILKKNGTTITPCPQCKLQALTPTKKQNVILCPFCGYTAESNSFYRRETRGAGIAAISHNGKPSFYRTGALAEEIEKKLKNHDKQAPPPHYMTTWDQHNTIPVIIRGLLKSLIDPTLWRPLPTTNEPAGHRNGKVLKIAAIRGHETKTAFIHAENVYVHRTNDEWDVYKEQDLSTTNIPYALQPLRTIDTTDPKWQEMIATYRKQEGIEEYSDG
jgi:hypothetical protein